MFKKQGKILLSISIAILISGRINTAIAEAPQVSIPQLRQEAVRQESIPEEIDSLCKRYSFPYPTLMKKLAWAESRMGKDKRHGDGGKAYGLYQWHLDTWKEFQKKFNRYDLHWTNSRDQIEMTILALQHGYWYRWGTLKRWYRGNPIGLDKSK